MPHRKYNAFNTAIKEKFGQKVFRVTLNTGLSCPNIDGTRAKGGCYFCNDDYLLAKSFHKQLPLQQQIEHGIAYIKERHPNTNKVFAYFQNGTNTHGSVAMLRPLFNIPLKYPEVAGLIISTRPDCLSDEILDLLSELNEKTYLWVEIGLQSHQDHILEKINRAHSVQEHVDAVHKLHDRGILNCTHMIVGMPGESKQEILEAPAFLNQLPIDGIKIHNMFVTEHTALAKWYRNGEYEPLTLNEYAEICVDYLELLRPDIIIHRLNAHAPARLTVAPEWSINKLATMNAVHKILVERDSFQGKRYNPSLRGA